MMRIILTTPKEFRMHSDAPWSQEFEIKAKPEWESAGLCKYVCEKNNRGPGGKCEGE